MFLFRTFPQWAQAALIDTPPGAKKAGKKNSQWLGLAEGSRTWRKKGFCSLPPEDWQKLACPGAMLSFSLLSIRAGKKKKFSLPAKTRWQFGGSCAPRARLPRLTSFRWLCWRWASLGIPAKAGGPGLPGNVHLLHVWT